MRTKEDILSMLKDELPNLRAEYGVDTLAVFGSYARGHHREAEGPGRWRGGLSDVLGEPAQAPLQDRVPWCKDP